MHIRQLLVHPARASPSYCTRLVKAAHVSGASLVFPGVTHPLVRAELDATLLPQLHTQ